LEDPSDSTLGRTDSDEHRAGEGLNRTQELEQNAIAFGGDLLQNYATKKATESRHCQQLEFAAPTTLERRQEAEESRRESSPGRGRSRQQIRFRLGSFTS
jgi:hypothetical protein